MTHAFLNICFWEVPFLSLNLTAFIKSDLRRQKANHLAENQVASVSVSVSGIWCPVKGDVSDTAPGWCSIQWTILAGCFSGAGFLLLAVEWTQGLQAGVTHHHAFLLLSENDSGVSESMTLFSNSLYLIVCLAGVWYRIYAWEVSISFNTSTCFTKMPFVTDYYDYSLQNYRKLSHNIRVNYHSRLSVV